MQIANITPIRMPIEANVSVPGSKSYSLRALFISALCNENFSIGNLLASDDTDAMQNCLDDLAKNKSELFAGESGITSRFILALACLAPGVQVITGAPGLTARPIKDLVEALRQLGAKIDYIDKDGFLPLRVSSSKLTGDGVNIRGDISSQYLSALMLVAPTLTNGLAISVSGDQTSRPYIDMTICIMNDFGVQVENQDYKKYVIKPQKYISKDYVAENDYSSAGYFFAIAALSKSKITVQNLNPDSRQADKKLLRILEQMGASVHINKNSVLVEGQQLKPITVDMNDCPDQAMTVAVLAAFADGKTVISGIRSLRIKETERVKAIENELTKMNIKTESTEDSLTIYGGQPTPANIDTYGDHRMAMSFAVGAARLNGLNIFRPEVSKKTFPAFWNEMQKITPVEIKEFSYSNIVLTGMRGTGKSTVGRIIAKKLKMRFVDVDKFIETKNKINIKTAVKENGWEYFRRLESNAIAELSSRNNTVISTGAGAILEHKNIDLLRNNSLVFMLKAEPKTLAKRISRYNKLPALTEHKSVFNELEQVWQERKKLYYSSCDFIVETENLFPEGVATKIIAKLEV